MVASQVVHPVIQFIHESDRELFDTAINFGQKQVKRLIETYPDFYPMYTAGGAWKHAGPAWTHWCDGFLPGMMWLFLKYMGTDKPESKYWMEQAIRYSKPLESRKTDKDVPDLGFIFFSTYYRWYQFTRDPALREVVIQAGGRWRSASAKTGQYLRSFVAEDSIFIDIMMNVGIVFYAARETNDKRLRELAVRHCITTRRVSGARRWLDGAGGNFRPGDRRVSAADRRSKAFAAIRAGRADLAWAMYGFTVSTSTAAIRVFCIPPRLAPITTSRIRQRDGVPPWDYNAPVGEPRTCSIRRRRRLRRRGYSACAGIVGDPMKGHFYWSTAIHILRTLCDEVPGEFRSEVGRNSQGRRVSLPQGSGRG